MASDIGLDRHPVPRPSGRHSALAEDPISSITPTGSWPGIRG